MSDLRTWDAWRDVHQPFELHWWKAKLAEGHSRDDAQFRDHWLPVDRFIAPSGRVLDIGCGPRPPFPPCTVIEPLAKEFREITPDYWWAGVEIWAQPAETMVENLRGAFDTVICWNCLDHTIGWREILGNMAAYATPHAKIGVATDFYPPFTGHPGFERGEFMSEIEKRFEVIDKREPFGRHLALLLKRK